MWASSSSPANADTIRASAAPATLIGATNAATDAGTSLTYSIPAGAQVGDLLLAFTSIRSNTPITAPSGWTGHTAYGSTTITQRAHSRIASSGDLTTTHTVSFGGTPIKAAGVLLVFRGASTPFLTSLGQTNASATSIAIPGLTMTATDVVLLIAASKAHSDAHSQASGFVLNPAATAASGGTATTANRVSVHYRAWSAVNPPSTTIAAGATAAVSVGVQMAIALAASVGESVTASPGAYTATGPAAILTESPHHFVATATRYDIGADIDAALIYTAVWSTLTTIGSTAASYSDLTASPATTYAYRVVAVNGSGETPSNSDLVTTFAANTILLFADPASYGLLGAAAGLATERLTAEARAYTITGTAATLDNPALVWEVIDTVGGAALSYSDFGLDPATGYVYRVVAVNAEGEMPSHTVVVYTPAETNQDFPMAALEGLVTIAGADQETALTLPALRGTHTITGTLALFVSVRELRADPATVTFAGADVVLVPQIGIAALRGTYSTAGVAMTMVRSFEGQMAPPIADVTDGAWTPSAGSDLYATIDEPTDEAPVDSDYMRTVTPVNDTAVVAIAPLEPPPVGEVQILVRTRTG
jgi:hypothetical protein